MKEEKRIKVKIDVEVGHKKRQQEAEEKSADEGVEQDLEKLHVKKLTLFPPSVNVMFTAFLFPR